MTTGQERKEKVDQIWNKFFSDSGDCAFLLLGTEREALEECRKR